MPWQPHALIPAHMCLAIRERELAAWSRNPLRAHKLLYTNYCAQRNSIRPPTLLHMELMTPQLGLSLLGVTARRTSARRLGRATERYLAHLAPSRAHTSAPPQTTTYRENTSTQPSDVRDATTPSGEETSVLKRKSTWTPSDPTLAFGCSPQNLSRQLPHFNSCHERRKASGDRGHANGRYQGTSAPTLRSPASPPVQHGPPALHAGEALCSHSKAPIGPKYTSGKMKCLVLSRPMNRLTNYKTICSERRLQSTFSEEWH